ncbi:hypothetical protein VTL71DRAFT_12838 [Oculimacula yallundae]|uniref:Uncharacterized protein n=1 Tax=Oculimacula yallundae TaxID=86028 RepID=A0ABR4CQG9_9HELO
MGLCRRQEAALPTTESDECLVNDCQAVVMGTSDQESWIHGAWCRINKRFRVVFSSNRFNDVKHGQEAGEAGGRAGSRVPVVG